MAGLAVVGQDRFGVFPLKGKLLNVREASHQQIMKNEEIANIKKIIGLKQGKVYKDTSELRYSGIIIMADQDTDGFHIKGLLINFIHYFWPSLVQKGDFIFSLQTPIVKAFKGKKTLEFYNLTEYSTWKETSGTGWRIKYYKGLGTSTKEEAKQYFTGLDEKLLKYIYENQSGGKDNIVVPDETEVFAGETKSTKKATKKTTKSTSGEDVGSDEEDEDNTLVVTTAVTRKYNDDTTEAITLAFEKDRSDHRKAWLMGNDKKKILPQAGRNVSIPNFINRELILFSYDDCDRSLPSVCDGLKPSQRKVLYGAFLKRLYKPESEIRVSQLAAYVSEKTAYHHGEASVVGTIV
jgi:DNA topoisomerase-2